VPPASIRPEAPASLQIGAIEWNLAQPGGAERDTLADSIQGLRRQVRRLTGLVDTVVTASGLAWQAIVLARVELDLAALVRTVVTEATASPAGRDTPVTLDLEQSVMGLWDPVRVEQVVANLVSNAMKYGAGKPVRIVLRSTASEAMLSVQDEGPGIDPANRERIFERFFRAPAGDQAGGLGLGLAVVRELVEVMKGTVRVASEPGHGATFVIRLPRRPRDAQPEA
jgi:signal transduction histidine kinase